MTTAESFVLDSQDDAPGFLLSSDYRELLFVCSKPQLGLIAEYLELDILEQPRKVKYFCK